MADEWFYAKDGQQAVGPITAVQLKQLAAAGQVGPNDLVWKQGMVQWAPAGQVKGLLGGTIDQRGAAAPSRQTVPEAVSLPGDAPAGAPAPASSSVTSPLKGDISSAGGAGSEPWFYGFLAAYTKVFMWLSLGLCALSLLYRACVTLQVITEEIPGKVRAFEALFFVVFTVPVHGLAALAVLFAAALVLLAVDAGRNLRGIRGNSSGRD